MLLSWFANYNQISYRNNEVAEKLSAFVPRWNVLEND